MFSESENVLFSPCGLIGVGGGGGVGVFWKLQEGAWKKSRKVCWLNMTKYINLFLSILSLF